MSYLDALLGGFQWYRKCRKGTWNLIEFRYDDYVRGWFRNLPVCDCGCEKLIKEENY